MGVGCCIWCCSYISSKSSFMQPSLHFCSCLGFHQDGGELIACNFLPPGTLELQRICQESENCFSKNVSGTL